jgi:reactive intermediate/imine deaminase
MILRSAVVNVVRGRLDMQRTLLFAAGLAAGLLAAAPIGRGAEPARKVINLPVRQAAAPFSDSILAGNTLYLAGKIGLDPATRKVPADADQEARLMLDTMQANLAAAGLTMDDLVKVEVHCSDVSLFERFNAVYKTYFKGSDYPARAFLGSGPLLFGARFEITGIAVKPS